MSSVTEDINKAISYLETGYTPRFTDIQKDLLEKILDGNMEK